MQPLLSLRGIRRDYHTGDSVLHALDGIDLDIYPGEFVAIMGQSGSGKSTLMNILGCLDNPTAGSYRVHGGEAAELEPDQLAALRRDTFGFVFQRYNLLPTATAAENVEIPAIYAGLDKPQRQARALELLASLGIGDRAQHHPNELSGGQQQRVAIARALMNNPPVILADEPTGALDSKSSAEVMALLRQLHEQGRTIILITHDAEVAAHAQRIVHLQDGRITHQEGAHAAPQATAPLAAAGREEADPTLPELQEATKMAFRSLRANMFRTALTLLGIIIGVAAVVIMLAVGGGSKQQVLDQITAMGTNLLSVRPGAPGVRGDGGVTSLTLEDAEAIAQLPHVEMVVPERSNRFTVRYGNIDAPTTVQAVGPDMPEVREWPNSSGVFFTERDVRSYAPVAVLGETVKNNLFPYGQDPVGEYILVNNSPFEVIGVLTPKGASGWGGDQDDAVFVPITTGLIRILGGTYVSAITVKVDTIEALEETEKGIQELMLARHRVEDFSTRNMASFVEMATSTYDTFTMLLGAVAAISLLVGGIGVMNIMLVSVTERTREIGIRMATGARRHDIMLQFVTEAAVVCTLGGLLGVAIGLLASWLVGMFGMPTVFSPFPSILSFTCAVVTGLVFGIWPARKASRLDPVVALASE